MQPILAFFTPGPMEIAIIGVVAILLFGKRVPKIAYGLGSSIVEFKKGISGVKDEAKGVVDELADVGETAEKAVKS